MSASPSPDSTLDLRVAGLLHWLLALCLGVGVVYVVVGAAVGRMFNQGINALIALGGFALGLWLLRRDRVQLAALVAALTLFLAASLEAAAFGSATQFTPLLPMYALALAFPALVLGWREALITTIVEVVGLAVLAWMQAHGMLGDQVEQMTPERVVFFGTAYLVVLGGFLAGASRMYRATISQLQRAQASLSQTEARLSQLVREMPDGLVSLDADGIVTECNPAAARLCGLSYDDMVGRHFSVLTAIHEPRDPLAVYASMPDMPDTVDRLTVVRLQRQDGSTVFLEANPRVVHRGDAVRVQVVIRDITARQRMEDEHQALQLQLREARRLEAVGRLAGGIAHDFNNLLTVIVSGADMLRDAHLDSDSRELVEQVDTAAHRAAELTGQLLTFARKQVRKPRVLDLNEAVGELDPLLPRLIREDIEFVVHTADRALPVWADPTQLHQVMVNLVVNARDAMPEGGALRLQTSHVAVAPDDLVTRSGVLPGTYARLTVIDTGTGMDAETRARIFEPFYTTKGSDGTGLGLATVHGIVAQTGGTVLVTSEPGAGTTFDVYLPLSSQPVLPRVTPVRPDAAGNGRTVLVVDDEELVRRTIERVLLADGYAVLTAGHPTEALDVSGGHASIIDLLITDVVLPHVGGPELAERLRTQRDGLRVLFTSGYTESTVVRQGIVDEGIHFLAKPFTPDGLRRKLAEVFQA